MPRRVKGPDGIVHAFPDDATDDEIRSALGGDTEPPKGQRVGGATFGEKIKNAAGMLDSVRTGIDKKFGSTVLGLGELAGKIPNPFNPAGGNLREAVGSLYGQPGISERAFQTGREGMAYQNTPERVGGAIGTAAEILLPAGEGVMAAKEALPSAARAGGLFKSVMAAAKDVPVDMSAPGDVALRIADLAQRGGGTNWGPAPVRQFIQYVTDPKKAPMTYEVARDFASNISRLSADEFGRLTPTIQREVAGLRVALNKAVAEAANKAGKGEEYVRAMNEFAKAKRLEKAVDSFVEGAKKAGPKALTGGAIGAGLGAGAWASKHLASLFGGD